MLVNAHIKTALVAVLFISYHLNGFAYDLNSVQCLIKNKNLILTVNNSVASSLTLSTNTHSTFNQNTKSGVTTLILNINQFPVTIKLHPNKGILKIHKDCTINKIKP